MSEQQDDPSSTKNASPQQQKVAKPTSDRIIAVESNAVGYKISQLHPPPSCLERMRDRCMESLNHAVLFWIGVVVMILIIADGAFFFFLLIGAHQMCQSRTDCEPRNYWYNWSIQFLNVLFTYLATISLPWRVSNAAHLFGTRRKSTIGLDVYGQPSEEIWYHIRQNKRRCIVICLLANSMTQYANQASRVVYYNFELQDSVPGSIWTNVFFVASMVFAGIGGFTQLNEEKKLRKDCPERFPAGILESTLEYFQVTICRKRTCGGADIISDKGDEEDLKEREDKGRMRWFGTIRKWFKSDKTSLDMWGL